MPGNLAKVKKKLSIYARRRVRSVLTGNYGSVFKGRGMDFDDLRVYEYGDDIKDIDWKASARSKSPMIRRYVAIRKHNIMIVADSGCNMAAIAPSGEKKNEIASFAASVVAFVANQNGDLVGMTFGNSDGNKRFPLKEGAKHIENLLTKYSKAMTLKSAAPDMEALLTYVSNNYRERMFLIIITDVAGVHALSPALIKKLRVRHEQLYIMVDDGDITDPKMHSYNAKDVVDGTALPRFIRKDRVLHYAELKAKKVMVEKITHDLKRLGICSCHIDSVDNAIPCIFRMLEEQKHVRR